MADTPAPAAPVWTDHQHWAEDARHVAHARCRITGIWRTTVTRRNRHTGYPTGTPVATYRHDSMPANLEFASYEDALAWLAEHPAHEGGKP